MDEGTCLGVVDHERLLDVVAGVTDLPSSTPEAV
jgi:hypothetical protein